MRQFLGEFQDICCNQLEPIANGVSELGIAWVLHGAISRVVQVELDTLAGTRGALSVIGFSMGGRVALEMMRLEASRIARLVLLDTGVHPVRPGEAEQRHKLVTLACENGMTALVEQWLPMKVGSAAEQDSKLMESLPAMVLRHTPEIHQRQINALLSIPDAAPVSKNIRCPTLTGV